MHLRLIPLALACAVTAGCTTPETTLRVDGTETGPGFVFVAEDYDLYPVRRAEGEAWRLQDLRGRLNSAGLCTEGYEVAEREESLTDGRFFNGDIYRVTYRGRCAAQSLAPATQPEPMYTPMPMEDPVERLPQPPAEALPHRAG